MQDLYFLFYFFELISVCISSEKLTVQFQMFVITDITNIRRFLKKEKEIMKRKKGLSLFFFSPSDI